MKKSVVAFAAISIATLGLVACGDSESSPTNSTTNAPGGTPAVLPDTVNTLEELMGAYRCVEAYSCRHVYLVEMDHVMECYDGGWAYLSEYLPSKCGYNLSSSSAEVALSSSSELVPVSNGNEVMPFSSAVMDMMEFEPATDCYDGGANITISSIENLNIQCGGSTEGWKIYDKDHWILYTCTSGQWMEEEAFPCVLE